MASATHAQGELLAQIVPAGTAAVTLLTATELRTEVTLILATIHPGTAGSVDIDIFHDDSGSTYGTSNLVFSVQKADNADPLIFQAQHAGSGIMMKPSGTLGAQISVAGAVTFSVYGVTETLAQRVRGL